MMLLCIKQLTGDDLSNRVSNNRDNEYTPKTVNLSFATPQCVPGNAPFFWCHPSATGRGIDRSKNECDMGWRCIVR